MYLDAGREQEELQAEEDGAPCEGHAGGGLLPGGCRVSVIVGVTLRSGFLLLRMGHARGGDRAAASPPGTDLHRVLTEKNRPARKTFVCYCPGFLLLPPPLNALCSPD